MYAIGELENQLDSLVVQGRLVEPEVVIELTAFIERLLKLTLCFPEYDSRVREIVANAQRELGARPVA